MSFHLGVTESILFSFWTTDDIASMMLSCALIFTLGIGHEALRHYRAQMCMLAGERGRQSCRRHRRRSRRRRDLPEDAAGCETTRALTPPESDARQQQTAPCTCRMPDRALMSYSTRIVAGFLYVLQLSVAYLLM